MNGIMIKQGSFMAEYEMSLGNICKYIQKQKSERRKSERKNENIIINEQLSLK